ncbi:MAG: NADH-quinone oxidoreductase subunit E [Rhodobacteraceae bacterium]|nr:NADH-quinone oxidoreductase subunit E [Paracoccaceae bacterium]
MLRRLHPDQPASFAFTPANQAWAEAQITKYPEGRQASAIIPLLWRAQEQEGWLTRPAIEHIADMLDMAYIRALEVATFYFMFQLQPVGSVAHIQVCGTTSCMICGAEDLVAVCKDKIAKRPHQLSADGRFSWEEVECLGACANAPMAQIGKDYFEDLTAERLAQIIDDLAAGKVPAPGPQNGRFASEPKGELTSLTGYTGEEQNASVALAVRLRDTVKRIDGTEVPLVTPWRDKPANARGAAAKVTPKPGLGAVIDETGTTTDEAPEKPAAKPQAKAKAAPEGRKPEMLAQARGAADDLQKISGVGPVLEQKLNTLGVFHYWQIAAWSEDEIAWVDDQLNFKGRIARDDWITQATALAEAAGKAD